MQQTICQIRGYIGTLITLGSLWAVQCADWVLGHFILSSTLLHHFQGMQRFPACEGLQDRGCLCLALLTAGTEDNKVGRETDEQEG